MKWLLRYLSMNFLIFGEFWGGQDARVASLLVNHVKMACSSTKLLPQNL